MKRLATIAATFALVVTPLALPANATEGTCEVTSAADSGVGTLRDCLTKVGTTGYEAGSSISVNPSVTAISLNSPIAISVAQPASPEYMNIYINGPVTISPSNSFSTDESDRLLDINFIGTGTLILQTVTFSNAPHGAISITASGGAYLQPYDSSFTDNDTVVGSSQTMGAAIYMDGNIVGIQGGGNSYTGNSAYSHGGAIYASSTNASVILVDDQFSSNSSGGKGGAIATMGSVDIQTNSHDHNPLFNTNTAATDGGAIWAHGSVGAMYATFSGNTAGTSGGAIYSYLGDVAVYDSTFTSNSAVQQGGAIRVMDGFFDSTRSHFGSNSALTYGGAVRVDGSSGDVNTITQSSFVDNTAGANGGALVAYQPVRVGHSTFYSNDAAGNGGGMIVVAGVDLAFVTMIDNTAINGPDVYIVAGETSSIGSVYASSTALDTTSRFNGGMSNLYPGNFSTGLEGVFTNTGNLQGATYADFDFGSLQQFTALKFNYDYTLSATVNTTKGFVPGANSSLLGAVTDEQTAPYMSTEWGYYYITDQEGDDLVIEGPYTAGAIHRVFEGEGGGGGDDSGDVPSDPTSPNLSITKVSKGSIAAAGDSFVVYGKGLKDVTEVFVGGTKVNFVVQADGTLKVTSPALALGQYDLKVVGPGGQAVLLKGLWVVDTVDFSTWTKRSGDSIKIYAKNVIGAGKVQFFVDGREIAWINAVDGSDPKLRTANGFHYLVRSVELKASGAKTRFEVKLNGERVRRNTYTIFGN